MNITPDGLRTIAGDLEQVYDTLYTLAREAASEPWIVVAISTAFAAVEDAQTSCARRADEIDAENAESDGDDAEGA